MRTASYKKRRPSRGQWAIQRERCQIADTAPSTPFMDATALSQVLSQVLRSLPKPGAHWSDTLVDEWASLVGPDVARHTKPGRVDQKCLTVFVDSSTWLNELRFRQGRILTSLQKRFGPEHVTSIRFLLGT
jgi:predicted nucleic acid-binding Zn ribbon protein